MKKAIALLICATAACTAPADDAQDPQLGQTGLNLRSDILADTDVAGMGYTITGVDCDTGDALEPPVQIQTQRDLEDILLPGGHPGFEDRPFDADSEHLFADAFQTVPAGCYDVVSQPLNADGQPSGDCAPASQSGVQVTEGQTTEIMLINQCGSEGIGAIDAISVLNHAPQITDVRYEPSKFTCGESTRICVTATDPDSDPLQLSVAGPEGVGFELLEAEQSEDGFTQCVQVTVPAPGEYTIDLTVHDLMHDAEGNLVTIESALDEGLTSNSTIAVPVHAMDAEACICECPEGFDLNAEGTACERSAQVDAVFTGNELQVCEGDDLAQYGALGAQFPGGLTVQNPFFGENFQDFNGRLNEVGIWDCADTVNEWIGFSACVTLDAPGEYVIGLAADDQARLRVDGVELYHQDGNQEFRTWWMVPVQLSAGSHTIELQGYNQGRQGTLGAEIYGPFPVGSTIDDATMAGLDYENNIVWSTGDQIGGVFQSGTNSGYSCPDGFGLNLCGEVPTCTVFEQRACNE